MAESTLALKLSDYQSEVGDYLCYGRTYASMSTAQQAKVNAVIKIGYRRWLAAANGYQWSFLRPRTTLAIQAPYTTGTVTIVAGVVTLATGTWPTWAANGDLSVSGSIYSVSTRDSGTQITLDDTSVTASAGTSYSISTSLYTLPDDFGGEIEGSITLATSNTRRCFAFQKTENYIRSLKQNTIRIGVPQWFCILPLNSTTATTGQRFQIEFDSAPDASWTATYRYHANQDALSDSLPYPLGGLYHGDSILACMEAAAEERYMNIKNGPKAEIANERIAASIERDKRLNPASLGKYMGTDEDAECASMELPRLAYEGVYS